MLNKSEHHVAYIFVFDYLVVIDFVLPFQGNFKIGGNRLKFSYTLESIKSEKQAKQIVDSLKIALFFIF
jgi:hypothetical protein